MIETNKIYNEDCLETMKRMEDKSVDVVITSPPYNRGNNNMNDAKYQDKASDKLTPSEYFDLLDKTLEQLLRITKHYVFINLQQLTFNKIILIEWLYKYRFQYKERIEWIKKNVEPAIEPGVLNSQFEDIYCFGVEPHKRKFDRCFFERGALSNVIMGHNAMGNCYAKEHKATFPEYLPMFFIRYFTVENDLVYDPFMGSGTTALACIKTNRNFIGSEISSKYCTIAEKRINIELDQYKLAV